MFGHTGSRVEHRDRQPVAVIDAHRHAARRGAPTDTSTALSIRLPSRVITSVASAGSSAARCDCGSEVQGDAALGGQRRLGDQQRGDRRIRDALGHRVADLGAPPRQGPHQITHGIVLAELHETGDRVQLVGELVGLRPQGVGDALVGRQLALQRGEFGAVAHRDDRADPLALTGGAPSAQRQHPRPGRDHRIVGVAGTVAVLAGHQERHHRRVEPDGVDPAPDRVAGHPEQVLRAVVEQRDLARRCSPRPPLRGCCAARPPGDRPGWRSRRPPVPGCAA